MKRLAAILLAACTTLPAQAREIRPLLEGWRFIKGDPRAAMQPGFDDAAWRAVRVPHDWSMDEAFRPEYGSGNGFAAGGLGWYRQRFALSKAEEGKTVRAEFDGVMSHAEVWINGHRVGGRAYGYSSFALDLTRHLFTDGRPNVLALRVDQSRQSDSRYFSGSGVYRDVRLVISDPLRIHDVFVRTPEVAAASAKVAAQTEVMNEAAHPRRFRLQSELLAPDGAVVARAESQAELKPGSSRQLDQAFTVQQPQRWSPSSPVRYQLRQRLIVDGKTVDETTTPFGIRSIRFDPAQGFSLNGESLKLKGVCLHHDAGSLGAAVPVAVWERRLRQLQAIGVNAIRTSHNPPAPEFLELTDRLGLLVQVEAFDEFTPAKNKWVDGWNVGVPSRHGYAEDFEAWGVRDVEAMVRRDRNRPSVIMWSVGNEIDYPNDPFTHPVLGNKYRPHNPPASELVRLARPLVDAVRKLDPTRPVTAALASLELSEGVGLPALFDVVGYNYQEARYAADRKAFPKRVIYGSENRHDVRAWEVVRDTPAISAQFLWTGFDYLGEAKAWPQRGADFGLFDLAGFRKPRGWLREALWSDKPMVALLAAPATAEKIASSAGQGTPLLDQQRRAQVEEHWNWAPGTAMTVQAYANTAEVQLWLNGRLIGAKKATEAVEGVLSWTLPFEAGELRAIGLREGRAVAEFQLRTAGKPARIELKAAPGSDGIQQIEFQVVDAAGTRVPNAEPRLHFQTEGGLQILGIGNGNLADLDDPRDAHHAAYQGRGLAVLRQTPGQSGKLRVSAPGLPTAELNLQ